MMDGMIPLAGKQQRGDGDPEITRQHIADGQCDQVASHGWCGSEDNYSSHSQNAEIMSMKPAMRWLVAPPASGDADGWIVVIVDTDFEHLPACFARRAEWVVRAI